MSVTDTLAAELPEAARDLRLNLQAVLRDGTLTAPQRWGVAVAAALASRSTALRDALVADAAAADVPPAVIEDATAAAALMGMNNVYYRFRHLVGQPGYAQQRVGLRMNRLVKPATSRADFELFALAVSAINACETCIRGHERALREQGVTEEQVNDVVRIAAVVHGAAVGLQTRASG